MPWQYDISFFDNTHIASLSPGTHTITVEGGGIGDIFPGRATFVVGEQGTSTVGATLNVSSTNVVTTGPVTASWGINGTENVCDQPGYDCQDLNGFSYTGVATGSYAISSASTSQENYSLRSIGTKPLAVKPAENPILAFLGNLVHKAYAYVICSANPGDATCTENTNLVDLQNQGDVGSLVIQWYPEPAIAYDPASISVATTTTATVNVTIADNGAPGSELYWTAQSDESWMTFPTGNSNHIKYGAGSSTLQVLLDATGLSATGTANLKISGQDPSGTPITSVTIPVTLSIKGGNGGGPPPTATLTANKRNIKLGQQVRLTWTSTHADTCIPSAAPAENDWSQPLNPVAHGSQNVKPPQAGTSTFSIACTGSGGTANAQVQVYVKGNDPTVCSIKANPQSVIIPGGTTLSYNCQPVYPPNESCYLSDTQGDPFGPIPQGSVVSGTYGPVYPKGFTEYSVICVYQNGGGTGASATVPVTVTNPYGQECPPEGCTP